MPKVVICPLDEMGHGTARRVDLDGHRLAIVRCDDDVYALGDRCSHADVSLSEGEIHCDQGTIECWKHGSAFRLLTGMPTSLPATRPVDVFDVEIENGQIVVVLP